MVQRLHSLADLGNALILGLSRFGNRGDQTAHRLHITHDVLHALASLQRQRLPGLHLPGGVLHELANLLGRFAAALGQFAHLGRDNRKAPAL